AVARAVARARRGARPAGAGARVGAHAQRRGKRPGRRGAGRAAAARGGGLHRLVVPATPLDPGTNRSHARRRASPAARQRDPPRHVGRRRFCCPGDAGGPRRRARPRGTDVAATAHGPARALRAGVRPRLGCAAPRRGDGEAGRVPVGRDQRGTLGTVRLGAPGGAGCLPLCALLPARLPHRSRVHADDHGGHGRREGRPGTGSMTGGMRYVRWSQGSWRGWRAADVAFDVEACLAAADGGGGRRSRHARSLAIATPHGVSHVKSYPSPGGSLARRAFAMGRALATAGFAAPVVLLVGRRGRAGLLVTADTGGEDLLVALARLASPGDDTRVRERDLLRRLGTEGARLHAAGFVHGHLVPPNLPRPHGAFLFLDNHPTRPPPPPT